MTTKYAKDYDCKARGHYWVRGECDFCCELASNVADALTDRLETLGEKAREYASHRGHGEGCGPYGHCGCGLRELEQELEKNK